jgi:enoyl-CoA hydratase/carnithine racemase
MGRWNIARVDGVHVVTMASNKVNAMNDDFFTDLQATIAALQSSEVLPVVLTGTDRCFCAGLDLRELFELDRVTLTSFVDRLDATVLAWLSLPRPTVAAINGHAIAGGCVLASACDVRVAVDRDAKIGVNEVQVGIPFPAVPLAVMRHAVSPAHLREVMLLGLLYTPEEARVRGLVDVVVPSTDVLTQATAMARNLAPDTLEAYAALKTHLLAPTLAALEATREQVNRDFLDVWFSESGRRRLGEMRDRLLKRS